MRARFYVDPATGSPHIHGHDVNEDEVNEVLEQPYEDRKRREGRGLFWGKRLPGGIYTSQA